MLYADVTALQGPSGPGAAGVQRRQFDDGRAVTNVAPYWRVALEPHWGTHYLMVGTFGMYGQIVPGRQYGFGTDNYLDVGFDSQYQYDGDQYSVTVKLTDIMEWQKLNATYGARRLVEPQQHAQQLQGQRVVRLGSHLQHRLRLLQHHRLQRLQHVRVGPAAALHACQWRPSAPFRQQLQRQPVRRRPHPRPRLHPVQLTALRSPTTTWNARLGIQFTEYLHLYGGTNNFDGSYLGGTHNAAGNNSVFAYAWLAF